MSDRRVLAVSAAFITAAIFLFLLGTYPSWKAAVGDALSWHGEPLPVPAPTSASPAPAKASDARTQSDPVPLASATAVAQSPAPSGLAGDVVAAPATSVPGAAASPVDGTPSFDIVRVEPSGESVIAARTKAGATVTLLDQGRPIAQAQADQNGQVAFLPPALAPGEHSLMLSLGEPQAAGSLSSQSVAVSIPAQAKTAPMVALLQPDQPTRVLSSPAPATPAGAVPAVPPVTIGAIDVEEMGSVFATGRAAPNSQCRIYLNGSFVAGVTTGKDGTWSLKIQRGMKPGRYTVRVDQLASTNGDVQARSEVPFDYPARAASSVSLLRPRKGGAPAVPAAPPVQTAGANPRASSLATSGRSPVAAQGGSEAAQPTPVQVAANATGAVDPALLPAAGVPTVVAQLLTTKVSHGDSLWRISRKMLGHGRRYTQIYAANTSQIRDPALIYPGQIFVMPQNTP